MKKFILMSLATILPFMIVACDNTTLTTSQTSNNTSEIVTSTVENTSAELTTVHSIISSTDVSSETTAYEKDGDIMNYFRVVGDSGIYGDGSDYNDEPAYRMTLSFEDGMTVDITFVDLVDSEIKIFDLVADLGSQRMVIQCYWDFQYDTSVIYTNGEQYLNGWLAFNGFDQSPVMSLAAYEYDVTGTNTEAAMQTMLNALIDHLMGYFETNIVPEMTTLN